MQYIMCNRKYSADNSFTNSVIFILFPLQYLSLKEEFKKYIRRIEEEVNCNVILYIIRISLQNFSV